MNAASHGPTWPNETHSDAFTSGNLGKKVGEIF